MVVNLVHFKGSGYSIKWSGHLSQYCWPPSQPKSNASPQHKFTHNVLHPHLSFISKQKHQMYIFMNNGHIESMTFLKHSGNNGITGLYYSYQVHEEFWLLHANLVNRCWKWALLNEASGTEPFGEAMSWKASLLQKASLTIAFMETRGALVFKKNF